MSMLKTLRRYHTNAWLSARAARLWLATDREKLIDFCVAIFREFKSDYWDNEYPEGEEPDEDEKDITEEYIGYNNGGPLIPLCWYVLIKGGNDNALGTFLKNTRRPHRVQFEKSLRQVYVKVVNNQ